ncbi:hypothetical protein SAMN04487944_12259 [Gracilibacillus ureilyticus]|uniref:Uncharacterized protein n=1 Tax=Gracilibacillus ureilyticus TaxID=531814 RepID=A0A1H9VB50_9BACI|nr:hypothetical protein [Gracilibacillus ureilyticus]SES18503.1 hypothetical protein SAMN04487944_12259 [Gracilibacillus ureilyticus]
MNRLFTKLIIILLLVVLSACNTNSNTISVAELTDRENTILSTTSDNSIVFDFEIDGEYKELTVWIEKYEAGKLVDDRISKITTQINESGSIIFSTPQSSNTENQKTLNIGIGSNGIIGSTNGYDENSDDLDNMASVIGNFPEKLSLNQDKLVLAHICYSNDKNGMRSLATEFYEDPAGNINKLKEYDVAYLLIAEFIK